jgi:crotonobetainyl-CoA:carnitine CoA-transferase CaiB-like acyl-CoA transferase
LKRFGSRRRSVWSGTDGPFRAGRERYRTEEVFRFVRPLEGIRIVAIEQYGAGPFGTMHLAELGAEVIKIEDPSVGGDVGRYVPPFQEGEDSLFFETYNRNKRSLSLDLTNPAGRSVFEDLVRVSDAVYSNLRGDVPARLRIRYDDLKELNPGIVCCSLSGFGMNGPRRSEPAYDYLVQALAGWMSITGEPEGPPTKSGLSLVDFCGGFVAALATLAGIHASHRDGRGMDCDLSLFDVAVTLLGYVGTWYLTGDLEPGRTRHSAHPSLVPFQNFATADGWIVVGCAKEKFWRRVVEVIGRPDLLEDHRFEDFDARRRHAADLLPILEEAFARHPSEYWLDLLTRAQVPCARMNTVAEALAEPQTAARELIVEVKSADLGRVRTLASPVRVGALPPPGRPAPARHGDGEDILTTLLGYRAERIAELAAGGAFGPVEIPAAR